MLAQTKPGRRERAHNYQEGLFGRGLWHASNCNSGRCYMPWHRVRVPTPPWHPVGIYFLCSGFYQLCPLNLIQPYPLNFQPYTSPWHLSLGSLALTFSRSSDVRSLRRSKPKCHPQRLPAVTTLPLTAPLYHTSRQRPFHPRSGDNGCPHVHFEFLQ